MRGLLTITVMVVCFMLLTHRVSADDQEELRLIETQHQRQWVTVQQRNKMLAQGERLFDITEHQTTKPTKPVDAALLPTIPQNVTQMAYVNSLLPRIDTTKINTTINHLSSYFTRFYTSDTGVEAALWLEKQFDSIAIQNKAQVQIAQFSNSFKQPSIIARIDGSGSNANEVVIVGAHIDSVTWPNPTTRSPGADDDASGISIVLETFRVLIEAGYAPSRTIEFHGYAGEEAGLLGSQNIATDYSRRRVNVAGMLQFDECGYTGANGGKMKVVTDLTSPKLTSLLMNCTKAYCTVPTETWQCGYACSDHASFTRAGFAAGFMTDGGDNPTVHTASDVIDNLDIDYITQFVRASIGWVVEMASFTGNE